MKRATKILTPALFAVGAVAQSGASILGSSTVITNPSDTGVVYETYSICPTAKVTTITGPTSTYCPGPYCNGGPTNAPGAGSTTVWITEIVNYCPTATNQAGWLTTMTTTITEACPCMETHPPGYVPSGFTNAVVTCTVCGESSPVATILAPITSGPGAYAYATASAGAAAGAQAGSGPGSPGLGSGYGSSAGASAGAAAGAGTGAGAGAGSGLGSPGSGSGSNAQASAAAAAAAAAGANAGTAAPGSNNAAQYAPAGAGSNSTFTPPISPSAGSGTGSSASGISPPIAIQSHGAATRSGIDMAGTSLLGIAGLVGALAWQL
jgi:hypothetical protein